MPYIPKPTQSLTRFIVPQLPKRRLAVATPTTLSLQDKENERNLLMAKQQRTEALGQIEQARIRLGYKG